MRRDSGACSTSEPIFTKLPDLPKSAGWIFTKRADLPQTAGSPSTMERKVPQTAGSPRVERTDPAQTSESPGALCKSMPQSAEPPSGERLSVRETSGSARTERAEVPQCSRMVRRYSLFRSFLIFLPATMQGLASRVVARALRRTRGGFGTAAAFRWTRSWDRKEWRP